MNFKKIFKEIITLVIFVGIGVFFIWYFVKDLTVSEKKEIIESFQNADYSFVIIAIICGLASVYFRAVRWKMLIKPLGYNPSVWNLNFSVMVAYISNLALPRLGEITRCGVLTKYEHIPFNKSFGTVISERVIDFITVIIIMLLTVILEFEQVSSFFTENIFNPIIDKFNLSMITLLLVGLGIIVLFILIIWIFRKRISNFKWYISVKNIVLGFADGLKSILMLKKPMIFILYTIIIWILYFLMSYVVFFSLPSTSVLGPGAGFAALSFGAVAMIISQGGIGAFPFFIQQTLALYGIAATAGYAMGWIIWSTQTIMIIIGGLISLILLPIVNKNKIN